MVPLSAWLATLAAFCFGTSFLLVRRAQLRGAKPGTELLLISCINLVGALTLLGLRHFGGMLGGMPAWQWQAVGWFLLAGLASTFLGRYFVVIAMKHIGPSRATAFKSLAPLLTALLAALLLDEALNGSLAVAALLVGFGLWRLNTERQTGEAPPPRREVMIGWALGLGSALSWSLGYMARRSGLAIMPSPGLGVAIGALLTITLLLIINARQSGLPRGMAYFGEPRALITLGWSGLFSTTGQLAAFSALYLTEATAAAVILISLDPLFMLLGSRLVVGKSELITLRTVASMAITLAGCALAIAGR